MELTTLPSPSLSIVSGDPVSDLDQNPLRIYDVTEEDGKLYLNL